MWVYQAAIESPYAITLFVIFLPVCIITAVLNTIFAVYLRKHRFLSIPAEQQRQRNMNDDILRLDDIEVGVNSENQHSFDRMRARDYAVSNELERRDLFDPEHSNSNFREDEKHLECFRDSENYPMNNYTVDESKLKECFICLEDLESRQQKIVTLTCGWKREFHRNCMIQWLKHNKFWPICQKTIIYSLGTMKQDTDSIYDGNRSSEIEKVLIPVELQRHQKCTKPMQASQFEPDDEIY